METQEAQETETQENTFDEHGQTVETQTVEGEETVESEEQTETTGEKYRIGDQEFATQKEALAYAQQLEADKQVSNAYQQGLRDALNQAPQEHQSVTPTENEDEDSTEELFTDPKNYLKRYAERIKQETRAEFDHRDQVRTQSNQIWQEFTDRHPMLADFRAEVEEFVEKNADEVKALIASKGRPAGYDHIATKMKSRFSKYASALNPGRELPNTTTTGVPTSKTDSVTPKKVPQKALSFYEQVRKIRKRG